MHETIRYRNLVRKLWPACVILGGMLASVDAARGADTYAAGMVFDDRNRNGVRDAGEKGLAGVRVSNQRDVVSTDNEGRWRLPVDDDTTFFVIKPRGWMTPVDPDLRLPRFYYTHKPNGSPKLKYDGVKPTGPLPESIDFPLYMQEEPSTFRAVFFGDTQSRNDQELEYMAQDVVAELAGFDAAFGVTLGDILFNDLSLFDHHNQTVALIGLPWYNVIGNHDINQDADDDAHSDETFERVYGPNYYSFDYGPTHFIVLDNVKWIGTTSQKKGHYVGDFGEDQLTFVKNDLTDVPEDQLIVLMMHIPVTHTGDREKLYRLIEGRPYTFSISGHHHTQAHLFLEQDDGWRGDQPHHHLINVTVCGSWWSGPPDERGIPHTTMADGAPNGYTIITFDRHHPTIEFKAASRPADYQMNIFAPVHVRAKDAAKAEVVVNVFNGSPRSKVRMRLGETGSWLPMQRVAREDPGFARMKKAEEGPNPPPGRKLPKAIQSAHIWQAKLPTNPPLGTQWITVQTTDMHGKTHTARRKIRILAD